MATAHDTAGNLGAAVTLGAGLSPIKTPRDPVKAEHTVVQPTTVTQDQILGDEELQILTMKIIDWR